MWFWEKHCSFAYVLAPSRVGEVVQVWWYGGGMVPTIWWWYGTYHMVVGTYHTYIPPFQSSMAPPYHTVSLSAYDIDTSLQKTSALSPRAPNSLHTFCAFTRQLVRAYHGS